MIEQNRDLDHNGSARRKLVRGVFAVPAVLTLYSGGASAATSANSCLVKRNLSPIALAPTSSDDMYFRYRLWVIRKKSG